MIVIITFFFVVQHTGTNYSSPNQAVFIFVYFSIAVPWQIVGSDMFLDKLVVILYLFFCYWFFIMFQRYVILVI